jgi:hypothetical protein
MWDIKLLEKMDTAIPNHAAHLGNLLLLFATDVEKLKHLTAEYRTQYYSLAEHSYGHFSCFTQIAAQCAV